MGMNEWMIENIFINFNWYIIIFPMKSCPSEVCVFFNQEKYWGWEHTSVFFFFKWISQHKLFRSLTQLQWIPSYLRNNVLCSHRWRVCLLYSYACLTTTAFTFGHRKGMGAGIKLMSKETKMTDLETTERLAYTKQEWWPRILTAFSSLVLLSPEVHLQFLPISSEKLPIDFQENVLFFFSLD